MPALLLLRSPGAAWPRPQISCFHKRGFLFLYFGISGVGWPQGGPEGSRMDRWTDGHVEGGDAGGVCSVQLCWDLLGCSTGWIYGIMGCVELSVGLNLHSASSTAPCSVPQFPCKEALQRSRLSCPSIPDRFGLLCWIPIPLLDPISPCIPSLPPHPSKRGWG